MGGSSRQTIGYAYYMGLHMVIARSADKLLKITVDDRDLFNGKRYFGPVDVASGHFKNVYQHPELWSDNPAPSAPVDDNEQVILYQPDLFGGSGREGGIAGAIDVCFGRTGQTANDYLEGVLGAPQPAYLRCFSVVFRGGMITAMTAYPKPWKFRVRRNTTDWHGGVWYSAKCEIDVGDGVMCMNPAHIIYQVLTDVTDGMGLPRSSIDDTSFTAAADTFYNEGLGLSFEWSQQSSIDKFVQQVLAHAGATLSEDRETGAFKLIPMRADYDPDTLPVIDESNGYIEKFDRLGVGRAPNELTVRFHDTYINDDRTVTLQALDRIQASGGNVVAEQTTYEGCPTLALAKRLCQRDLDIKTPQLARLTVRVNRKLYKVLPGQCVKLQNFSRNGITSMIMRVLKTVTQTTKGQYITLEGTEDVFGMPSTTYAGDQTSGWTPIDGTPYAAPAVDVMEVPYRDMVQALGDSAAQNLDAAAGYACIVAAKPAGVPFGYRVYSSTNGTDYTGYGEGQFAATGTLQASITAQATAITLTNLTEANRIEIGAAAVIGSGAGAEIVRIDAQTGSQFTIGRGCADTVAHDWPIGTRVWFYDNYAGSDGIEYVDSDTVWMKAATVAGSTLPVASAPGSSVALNARQARPYVPAAVAVNGHTNPTAETATANVTWAHRDRTGQGDTLIDQSAASTGPEPGTTYTVTWYINNAQVNQVTGVTGTSANYTPTASGNMRVEVKAVRDGLDSWQIQTREFTFAP